MRNKMRLGDIATLITKGTTPTSVGYTFTDTGVNFVKIESIREDGTLFQINLLILAMSVTQN